MIRQSEKGKHSYGFFNFTTIDKMYLTMKGLINFNKNTDTLNPFPHTKNLQQTTLKTAILKYGISPSKQE